MEIATVHVKRNQTGNSLAEWGKKVSDNKATEAALQSKMKMKLYVVPEVKPPGKQAFKKEEIASIQERRDSSLQGIRGKGVRRTVNSMMVGK